MEIYDRVEAVGSRADLIEFVLARRADLTDNEDQWENPAVDPHA